jgi:hypothetical protein
MYDLKDIKYDLAKIRPIVKFPKSLYQLANSQIEIVSIVISNEITDNIRGGLRDIDITYAKTLMIHGNL